MKIKEREKDFKLANIQNDSTRSKLANLQNLDGSINEKKKKKN